MKNTQIQKELLHGARELKQQLKSSGSAQPFALSYPNVIKYYALRTIDVMVKLQLMPLINS